MVQMELSMSLILRYNVCLTFNSSGTLLKTKPFSVKIIQNQLYVVDYASHLLKIFDMD